jgi:hypothetical protein
MRIQGEGPIIGLNDGWISIGDPVRVAFFAISAMKTAVCMSVKQYTTHGILPFDFLNMPIPLLRLFLPFPICGGMPASPASYT